MCRIVAAAVFRLFTASLGASRVTSAIVLPRRYSGPPMSWMWASRIAAALANYYFFATATINVSFDRSFGFTGAFFSAMYLFIFV